MSNLIIPTFKTGYATSPGESRAPDLWSGLKAAWLPFLGATGLELRDLLNQNHATLINMEVDADWVIDETYALNFDPPSEYVNVPDNDALNLGVSAGSILRGSVAVWFKPHLVDTHMTIACRGPLSVSGETYAIFQRNTGIPEIYLSSLAPVASITATALAAVVVNTWNLAIGTWDGSNLRFYLNGKFQNVTPQAVNATPATNNHPFRIAADLTPTYLFDGRIRQVELWDRDLTGDEAKQLFDEPYVMWQLVRRPMSVAVSVQSMTATAAAVVSTTATLTKEGIVNMTATATAVTSTTASLTVGVTESMTATAAAVTSATAKLTFVGEKDFFLDIPIHTLSIDNSTQILKPFTNAIPIDHGLTIDNTTGVIKVETNAIPIPSLSSDAARVLPRTNPGAVLLYTGVYNDFTAEARDNTPDDVDLSQGAGTILYIGYKEKFYAVRIIVSTAGVGSYTMEAAKYWNGAAWVTLAYSDGELNDFKTAETIHIAGLPNDPDDWAKTTVNGSELYWISMETLSGTQSQKPLAQRISLQIVGVASYRFVTFSSEEVYQEFF